jgi:signal transduction histidine kinase
MAKREVNARRIALISATVMMILGVIGILGWATGFYLALKIPGAIPISPAAAVAYILLGLIILILAIPLRSTYAKWSAKFLTTLIMVIGCMFWITAVFIPSLDIQKIVTVPLVGTASPVETSISPLAAFAIFLGTIALTRIIYMKIKWRHYDTVMGIISVMIFSIGFLSLIGYAFGTPQFYGSSMRSVSISSSFALVFLGLGIMALNGPSRWPLSVFMRDTISAQMVRVLIPLIIIAFICYGWALFRVITPTSTGPVVAVVILTAIAIVAVTYAVAYVSERTRKVVEATQNERAKAIEALALANKKLEILDSLTRHDILNLVSLASLEAELAKRMSRDQQVQNSAENISKINKTITALLQFSKEYKQIGLERPRWVNVEEVLSRATRELERGGEVTVDNLCVNWKVFADPMIERAFFNILENSLRHGEKVTRITVECGSSGEDGKLRIVFSDNGVGIPVAEKERIFEKGVGKNTGLGLFLVRQILSITGMSIRENGIPGKGARFEITVPKDAFEATSQSLSE